MSANHRNENSCVETPAEPEWLSKLELNREKLKQSKKLGHESGAGAPCNECKEACSGLDLHFWRKVCRNCKCRKDQHMCVDEISGWAQFEILGQIRSKPAYIKIKALENKPVQLEWVPPNVAPDVINEYMEKLGADQIPVAGSVAASKRKQQLEYQVPPHDLDATLCDNLSEAEKQQLLQYVQKIRENCVGQGSVVRIGNVNFLPITAAVPLQSLEAIKQHNYQQVMASLHEAPVADAVLSDILSSEKLSKAIVLDAAAVCPKLLIAFAEPISQEPVESEPEMAELSSPTKSKICGLNKQAVCSLLRNGPIYDKFLNVLMQKNLDVSRDPKLGPIADFRKEYLSNPQFKQEVAQISPQDAAVAAAYAVSTPNKSKPLQADFNSPLPLRDPIQARLGTQMRQETPLRKAKFGTVPAITLQQCGLPSSVDYEKDAVFANILNSEPLKQALQAAKMGKAFKATQLCRPLISQNISHSQQLEQANLRPLIKHQLLSLGLNNEALQSAVLNGGFYDKLFDALQEQGINYEQCAVLKPLKTLRDNMHANKTFHDELMQHVLQLPNNAEIAYSTALKASNSNDSGFDSKPSTPNHGNLQPLSGLELKANAAQLASIPGLDSMNMYPTVKPNSSSATAQLLANNMQQLVLADESTAAVLPVFNCADCAQPINNGDVVVKAERAGKEIAWHPECFKCHSCRELLADLVYFFHGNHVYCGRDLAIKLKIPRCKACDELIFTKEYTAAEGATFHIKHFCCYQCDIPLAGQQYIPDEKSNMPLCLKCYDEYFAASCANCRRSIGPADQGVAWGDIHWHGACFVCAGLECHKSLIGGRFCVKNNLPFCSPACVRSIMQA